MSSSRASLPLTSLRVLLLPWLLLAATMPLGAVEPAVHGQWSAPVYGLRARLLLLVGTPPERHPDPYIYLELENVSDRGNPLRVAYRLPRLDLVDGARQPAFPRAGFAGNAPGSLPFDLMLPYGSSLRFPLDTRALTVLSLDGDLLGGVLHRPWIIPADFLGERFLAGCFEVVPPAVEAGRRARDRDALLTRSAWYGTISLPPIKVYPLPVTP